MTKKNERFYKDKNEFETEVLYQEKAKLIMALHNINMVIAHKEKRKFNMADLLEDIELARYTDEDRDFLKKNGIIL